MKSKEVEKIVNKKIEEEFDEFLFDEDLSSPCWEAKVDKNQLLFLIDGKKVLQVKAPKNITIELLSYYIQFLKEDRIEELSKEF